MKIPIRKLKKDTILKNENMIVENITETKKVIIVVLRNQYTGKKRYCNLPKNCFIQVAFDQPFLK